MNKLTFKFVLVVILFLSSTYIVISQDDDQDKTGNTEINLNNYYPSQKNSIDRKLIQESALEMINATRLCTLITRDSDDHIHVRTMQPFPPDKNLTVWMGTNAHSRKVKDIKSHPDVVLFYGAEDESGYVVLYGKAKPVNDPELKHKYWLDEWENFYPDKSSYILIKFSADSLEILNPKKSIFGDQKTWKVPSINIE
jgi:general stress protein 26